MEAQVIKMDTTEKICCYCKHYRLGFLENPCEKSISKCGYLHEGCGMWEERGEGLQETPIETKPLVINARYGKQRRPWTDEEDALLREMYSFRSIRMIEIKLNRSRSSIVNRAFKLGIQGKR